jgi:hypothetical protein
MLFASGLWIVVFASQLTASLGAFLPTYAESCSILFAEGNSMETQEPQAPQRSSPTVGRMGTLRSVFTWIYRYKWRLLIAFMIVMHTLGFITSIRAIMETRTSQGAIAWGISLNTVPYVAVPAYWVFGQSKFSDYEVQRLKDILASSEQGRKTARILEEQGMLVTPETDYEKQQATLLEELAKMPITRFNDADLLMDGQATFDAIFEGITSVKDYILVQFYIMRDDQLGQKLKRALIETDRKIARGCPCLRAVRRNGQHIVCGVCRAVARCGDPGLSVQYHSRRGKSLPVEFSQSPQDRGHRRSRRVCRWS